MSFSVIGYSGPFPVDGSYNPTTLVFDDAAPVVTHRLVSERKVIPHSVAAVDVTEYSQVINTGDWVAGVGGKSTITILATTHNLADIPDIVSVFQTIGSDFVAVGLDAILIDSTTQTVVLRITTGDEFAGKVVLKT